MMSETLRLRCDDSGEKNGALVKQFRLVGKSAKQSYPSPTVGSVRRWKGVAILSWSRRRNNLKRQLRGNRRDIVEQLGA